MCFSATASFAVSGGLAVVGVASLRASTPKERIVAVIPLAFAAQQALEGVQWLALDKSLTCQSAGYSFLMFAYLFWPIYLPAVVYVLDRVRRPSVGWFLGLGIATAIWNVWFMLTHPLAISILDGHIVYNIGIFMGEQVALFYVAAISGAFLVSRIRAFFWGGIIAFATAVAAVVFARPSFPSVWCFVASVASILAYFYVSRSRKKPAG